ncbi:unnamed protein product [Adineta steineri]|uniref:Uncharacterized protein n=2 Tax=Adineta steineri TaxID=433720 RepID=A0A819YCY6_9BILA|nr:unnamed protein product [Adineta steineri]
MAHSLSPSTELTAVNKVIDEKFVDIYTADKETGVDKGIPFLGIRSRSIPLVPREGSAGRHCDSPSAYGWLIAYAIIHNGLLRTELQSKRPDGDIYTLTLDCDQRRLSLINENTNEQREIEVDIHHTPFPWCLTTAMNMNNRVGVDESVEINSNTTRLRRLFEHFRKRKLIWIICLLIINVVTAAAVTTTVLLNKTGKEKTSTEITIPTSTTSEQLIPSVIIDNNTKWKRNAITVAGRLPFGNQSNELFGPSIVYVDDDNHCIYIADTVNHRIVRWEFGADKGEIVQRKNQPGNPEIILNKPIDVILDKEKKYLIICNFGNRQVMKWSLYSANQVDPVMIRVIPCWGLAMDNNGDLYVSEWDKHQVRRFYDGDRQGTVVAGGNGQGNQFNQLNQPRYIFVDKDHSVYIADYMNNRVMKWKKNAVQGILIAPRQVSDKNPNSLVQPRGVIVDHMGNIYVSNARTHQITRWSPGKIEATTVAGEKESGWGPTQLINPQSLSFDRQGNLYVVDEKNHRIQKFDIDLN